MLESMNLDKFHNIFREYLEKKNEEVKLVAALETTMEKWFQGEMALAFVLSNQGYKLFSCEQYNEYDEKSPEAVDWKKVLGDGGVVVLEGNVFKEVKTGKYDATSIRKVDFLLENNKEYVFSEMKVLWFDDVPEEERLYSYLESNKVLEDAWRLRRNLLKEFRSDDKDLRLYLTLICIGDIGKEETMKEKMASVLNKYLEVDGKVTVGSVRIDNISGNDPEHSLPIAASGAPGDLDYLKDIFLMTIDIGG